MLTFFYGFKGTVAILSRKYYVLIFLPLGLTKPIFNTEYNDCDFVKFKLKFLRK